MTRGNNSFLLFLLGALSMTQVRLIGSLGLSELVIFIAAPFLFVSEQVYLRRHGFMPLIWLILLTCLGCIVSSLYNHTYLFDALKGFATPYSMFATMVVLHRLLRVNLYNGVRWTLAGLSVTLVLNCFFLQSGAELSAFADGASGAEATKLIMTSSPIFWISRLYPVISLPIQAWYFSTPYLYSVFAPFGFTVFAMVTTSSGRSSALVSIVSTLLLLIGGKNRFRMRWLKVHSLVFFVILSMVVAVFFVGYKSLAKSGALGEESQNKYENQTRGREGVLGLLMGGRAETFIGLFACLDKPIVGHGPWAIDTAGYITDFMAKYGTEEDYQLMMDYQNHLRMGGREYVRLIPAHSHIIAFWLWYGVWGLLLWLYILYLVILFVIRYLDLIPAWFGYMAIALPLAAWNIFFSPYGSRIATPLLLCSILFARAMAKGWMRMPRELMDGSRSFR